MQGFVYIITNKHKTVLYTGTTSDMPGRLRDHIDGRFKYSFAWKYNCRYLVWCERYPSMWQAIQREKQIKGWSRAKKEVLITTFNPTWKFLNDEGLNNDASFRAQRGNSLSAAASSLVLLLLVLFLTGNFGAYAQNTKAQIKNVAFELINDNIVVSYDIVKYKPAEKFKVGLNVYTALENKIEARSLSGDINENVSGGEHKKIVWDMRKDSIFLDNDIYVEVVATSQPDLKAKEIETPVVPGKPVDPAVVTVPPVATKAKTGKSVNMGKALLFSTIYPGWGDHYVKPNNAFWIIGAGAYGLAAWSVVSNRNAYWSYRAYLGATQIELRDNLYNDAVKKKRVSTYAISAAAAIWIADLTWVLVKSKKNSKEHAVIKKNDVHLGFGYNPETDKTILSVNVTF